VTEDEARAALRDCDGQGGVERWIAGQPWQATPFGWAVAGELQGWRFEVRQVAGGVQVNALPGGMASPAVWTVPARGRP
jgi:hypothetical protein